MMIEELNKRFGGNAVLVINGKRCPFYNGHKTAAFYPPNIILIPKYLYSSKFYNKILKHEYAHYLHYINDELTYCLEFRSHGAYYQKYLELVEG